MKKSGTATPTFPISTIGIGIDQGIEGVSTGLLRVMVSWCQLGYRVGLSEATGVTS